MSLSDRFRSFVKKTDEPTPAVEKPRSEIPSSSTSMPTPAKKTYSPKNIGTPSTAESPKPAAKPAPLPQSSPTLEELDRVIAQERRDGEAQLQAIEKEIQTLRISLEKSELAGKTRRDQQQQALEYLQQDAESEIKFLERKLSEDQSSWSRQLAEREKALEQAARQVENEQQQKKNTFEGAMDAQRDALHRSEQLLKEQEAKLSLERQKWQELMQGKANEILSLKQELARRENELEKELNTQETQRKAAQELWQTRMQELDKQWEEKRKTSEDAMKAKENERVHVQASLQERLTAWQLDQERRLQETTRRQERANEKLSVLKAQLVKETQIWQQLSQTREEQLQQLKVKLLLSESDAKGRIEQTQKKFKESVTAIAAQVQALQVKLHDEEHAWKQQLDEKDASIVVVKEDIHTKLQALERDYSQRLTTIQGEKESLEKQLKALEHQNQEEQTRYAERLARLKEEQVLLDANHQTQLSALQKQGEEEAAVLQAQILTLEKQKSDSEHDLEKLRLRWQEDLVKREQILKETQASIVPQEAELRKKFTAEEDAQNRQVEAFRTRLRAIERELQRARENAERVENEYVASATALEKDHKVKEDALKKRAAELSTRLQKRLEERRLALDAFQAMKKDEDARMQAQLQAKENERAEWAGRLERLPQELQQALDEKKAVILKESEALKTQIAALESELNASREEAKHLLQGKATELAGLRQSLEQQHKELAGTLKANEQMLEAERASAEKQMAAAQAEMERLRVYWQTEIDKKVQEIAALQEEMQRQEERQKKTLEEERKNFDLQLVPVEEQRQELTRTLEHERAEHMDKLSMLENERQEYQTEIQKLGEQSRADTAAAEARFRQERAQLKTNLEGLRLQQVGAVQAAQEAAAQKTLQIEQLEEQTRDQAVVHETRRRELMHAATQKSRTLQDIIHQVEVELNNSRDTFPQELKTREETVARLHMELGEQQERHQHVLSRFDRAQATLSRRAKQKEDILRTQLASIQNEWSQKIAVQDTEIAALQSNLLGKEAERQGELDRLAKQFAEERFQLEKTKEEIEWKLKDHKDVSERQLAGRQKEVQYLEGEMARAKVQRDEQLNQRGAAFEAEKQKLQGAIAQLQHQTDDLRKNEAATLIAKDTELQSIITHSKHRLKVLSEEFNQKVNSWRGTNEALKAQNEQLKGHLAQSQDHWEVLRKEKATEISTLRQELTQWEVRLQNDAQALERVHDQDRQMLITQTRKLEKTLEEVKGEYERKMADKDDLVNRTTQEIQNSEATAETQWHATLEQWEIDKQTLQQEKGRLERDLNDLQNRSEQEVRQTDEALAKLRMEITFKETETSHMRERMRQQMDKELAPLHDRLGELTASQEQERTAWETRLRSKEDDIKMLKARLSLRDKRLQDEIKRREKEVDGLRRQVAQETELARSQYKGERERLESVLAERRRSLNDVETRKATMTSGHEKESAVHQKLLADQRAQLAENIKVLSVQLEEMRQHNETLLGERQADEVRILEMLDARDRELTAVRTMAQQTAEELRKRMEQLRHASEHSVAKTAPVNHGAWNAFETGVQLYQAQRWPEAARAFEECLQKDPRWGAAYQYLALAQHAQGHTSEAAMAAASALQEDPGNAQLAAWVERLRSEVPLKKAS